jgi:hypothetical protein
VFSLFLIDYPMETRRLEQHFDFLVNNLNYIYRPGREIVLDVSTEEK